VIGGVGEGIGIDGDGTGSLGEEVGAEGDGRGSVGVATDTLGNAVGDGSGKMAAPAVDMELELSAGTPSRAIAAAAPRPARKMRASRACMAFAGAGCTAFRFIVSSLGGDAYFFKAGPSSQLVNCTFDRSLPVLY
jgi:hypothetical protein